MLRLLVAMGLLFLAAVGCGSREERFTARAERAETLIEAGRIEDALIELQGALKIDPKNAAANERMAGMLRDRGDRERAIHHYGEAYQLDPTRIDAALAQAELLRSTEPRRADHIVAALGRDHPDDPRILRAESAIALALGDRERALEAATAALAVSPEIAESWLQLGRVQRARARAVREGGASPDAILVEALHAFDEAERRAGGNVAARLGRARVLASWPGRGDEAIDAFRDAADLAGSRENAELHLRAGAAFERHARGVGDLALAREALRHQTAAAPRQIGAWDRLATVTGSIDGEEAALGVYRDLISRWPDSPTARIRYTARLARGGRLDEAISYLEATIASEHDHLDLHEQLVRLELARGNTNAARERAAVLRERSGGDVFADRAEARIAVAEGRYLAATEALGAFDPATANAETEALRAQIELARGRFDLARIAAEQASNLAAGFSASAQRLLVQIYAEAKDWAAAQSALESLERHGAALGPREHLVQARAAYASGDSESGRARLEALLEGPDPSPEAAVAFAEFEGPTRPDAARAHLERALRKVPTHLGLLEAVTHIHLREKKAPEARAHLDRAIAILQRGSRTGPPRSRSNEPAIRLLRADVLVHLGDLMGAGVDALRALELDPAAPAPARLVSIYRSRGALEAARISFEEADEAGTLPVGARRLLAQIQAAVGDSERAVATAERIVADRPDLLPAKRELALLLAARGEQLGRALELAEEAHRGRPDEATAKTLADVQLLRRKAAAPGRLEKLRESTPDP